MMVKFRGNSTKSIFLHVFYETFHQQTSQIPCKDELGKIPHQYTPPAPTLLPLTKYKVIYMYTSFKRRNLYHNM